MFRDFLKDQRAWYMYITGAAGTGKTTSLAEHVQYCIDEGIPYMVCAYTHKACGILRTKLPDNAEVSTLHSFLSKRPTINTEAKHYKHINSNSKSKGLSAKPKVVFVDEFSQVGERDYMDIVDYQDGDDYDDVFFCGPVVDLFSRHEGRKQVVWRSTTKRVNRT